MRKEISDSADQILKEISAIYVLDSLQARYVRLLIQRELCEAFYQGQLEGARSYSARLDQAFESVSALQNGAQKRIGESLVDARNLCGTQPELTGSLTGSKANKSE